LVVDAKIKSPKVERLRIVIPTQTNRLQSLDLLKEVNTKSVMIPRAVASVNMIAKMIQVFGPISEGTIPN